MAGPLDGIRVLDFTWALAGPFGTMLLADLGAEVWKVERVGIDEETRGHGPYVDGVGTYFFSVNRGKKSLAIDLKSEEGREIVYGLVKQVDVVTENFTPGTMDRLGLGYEDLRRHNPRLIYASTSGFGQTGPYRDRGAVDIIVQGMSGLMSITGHPDGPAARCGYSIGDTAGGMFTALGVLAALVERGRSGQGQRLDIAMLECQVTLLENAFVRYLNTGEVPQRIGSRHPLTTPFQAFPTKDGHLVLAGAEDWPSFCHRVGRPDLAEDPRFASNDLRTQHHSDLEPILTEIFHTRTTQEWLELLSDICLVAPLNTIDQAAQDPHLQERGMFVPLPAWSGATIKVANTPFKLSRTPSGPQGGAPHLGQDTREILTCYLGMSQEEVEALAARRVIGI